MMRLPVDELIKPQSQPLSKGRGECYVLLVDGVMLSGVVVLSWVYEPVSWFIFHFVYPETVYIMLAS